MIKCCAGTLYVSDVALRALIRITEGFCSNLLEHMLCMKLMNSYGN